MENTNNVVNEEIKVEPTETNSIEVKEEKTFTQEELDKILTTLFVFSIFILLVYSHSRLLNFPCFFNV